MKQREEKNWSRCSIFLKRIMNLKKKKLYKWNDLESKDIKEPILTDSNNNYRLHRE